MKNVNSKQIILLNFLLLFQLYVVSKAGDGLYQLTAQPLNCTPSIPNNILNYLVNTSPAETDEIPLAILTQCISNQEYDRNVPALFYNKHNRILFGMSISHVVSLEFNGDLQVKVNLDYKWPEPRFSWLLDSGINNWTWPPATFLQISQVWPLIFEVLNCPLQNCELSPQNHSYVHVNHTGTIELQMTALVFAKCDLVYTHFPFDIQSCNLQLAAKNYIQLGWLNINYSFKFWLASNSYIHNCDEWALTAISTQLTEANEILMKRHTPDNFTMEIYPRGNVAINCTMTLVRRPSYFIYNLIVPLLVIVCLGVATTLIPSEAPEKPEVLLTVLLAFTFYQMLLADNTPKTESVPLIGYYIMWSLVLAAYHLLSASLVLRLHHFNQENSQPPKFLRLFIIRPINLICKFFKKASCWVISKIFRSRSSNLINDGMHFNLKVFLLSGCFPGF